MRLTIGEKTYQYDTSVDSVNTLVKDIERYLEETRTVWLEMNIDGTVLYDVNECLEFIQEQIHSIKMIELKVASTNEVLDSILLSIEDYLQRAIPELSQLADTFYQGVTPETWSQFMELVDGLQWLIQAEHYLLLHHKWQPIESEDQSLQTIVELLGEAMNSTDTVMIADIITYEITPLYHSLNNKVSVTIDNEVLRHDLN